MANWARHVRGLNCGVPWPGECAILKDPLANTAVSTLFPGWSKPPSVIEPRRMMDDGALFAGLALMIDTLMKGWLPLAAAAEMPVTASAPATATALPIPSILLLSFIVFPLGCGERPSGPRQRCITG